LAQAHERASWHGYGLLVQAKLLYRTEDWCRYALAYL